MSSELVELKREVDALPEGWETRPLSRLRAEVTDRVDPVSLPRDLATHYVGLEHIGQGSGRLDGVGSVADVVSQKSRFRSGDILYGKLRPNLRKVARPAFDGVCSTDVIVLRAKPAADPDFLFQVLQSEPLVAHAVATAAGTKMPRTHARSILSFEIAAPDLDGQRRIAEVLRSVDEAITRSALALTQARVVRQSAINELLATGGGPDRRCYLLSEVLSIAHGFPFKSEYFTSNRDDPILLTPGNFSVEKTLYFGERTKHYSGPVPDGYVLEDGSLVVVMTDLTQDMAILGNAVEIKGIGSVLHNQRIGRVSLLHPDLVTKGYARLLLNSDLVQSRVKSTASGSTVRHTAPSRILECEVQLPPLEEQARIVAIAKSLDDIVIAEERRRSDDEVTGPLSHLRVLKDMIARDLLSGRVRVPA